MFALQSGQRPMFFRDNIACVHDALAKDGLSLANTDKALFHRYKDLDPDFQEALQDIMGSCSLFNNHAESISLGMVAFLELIISICYRLLRFRLLGSPTQRDDTEGALHLGSTIVMMTVFLQLGNRRMIDYTLVSQRLQEALNDRLLEADVELYLWLAIIGSIWISRDDESGWIGKLIQIACEKAGLTTWINVRSRIAIFPWIHVIHDKPGLDIWSTLNDV